MTGDQFVDSSVFLLAAGGNHPSREPCRRFLRDCRSSGARLHASVETLQEFLFHRMRRSDRETALRQSRAFGSSVVLHAFDEQVWLGALALVERTGVRGRDAVIASTALQAGFSEIVSLDQDLDIVPGLRRVDPRS